MRPKRERERQSGIKDEKSKRIEDRKRGETTLKPKKERKKKRLKDRGRKRERVE